ncbi:hypothetical protein [Aeromonas hydrophila]|uniref:hypothetical protein n=1 Tax=Aeromonas hydrophila TaxID=644 RepID=UPI003D2589A1
MRENWFRQRLTKAKQAAPMWGELADAVQQIFAQQVEPIIERLRGMGSAFTMSPEDLNRRIEELGPFFWLSDRVAKEDWPLALLQRQDEIHLKKTDYPLISTIAREFSGMQVDWAPLYAPKDQSKWPYGSRFTTLEMMEFEDIPPEDWFMTARGVIRVPLPKLAQAFVPGDTVDEQCAEFEAILARFVTPLIPLHIVFDGAQYYLEYTLKEAEEWATLNGVDVATEYPPAVEGKETASHNADIATEYPPASNNNLFVGRLFFDQQGIDSWTIDKPLEEDVGRQWALHFDLFDQPSILRISTITMDESAPGVIEGREVATYRVDEAETTSAPFPPSIPAIQAFKARMDAMRIDAWPFDTKDDNGS